MGKVIGVNGKGYLIDPAGRPLESQGQPVRKEHLTPDEVARRIKHRQPNEYEEAAKKCFRMAQFGIRCNWPKNITDDLVTFGTLLGEISVAKKEGIIFNG